MQKYCKCNTFDGLNSPLFTIHDKVAVLDEQASPFTQCKHHLHILGMAPLEVDGPAPWLTAEEMAGMEGAALGGEADIGTLGSASCLIWCITPENFK